MTKNFFLFGAGVEMLAGIMLIASYGNMLGILGIIASIAMVIASNFVEDIK